MSTRNQYIIIVLLTVGISLLAYSIFDAKQAPIVPKEKAMVEVSVPGPDGKQVIQKITIEQALDFMQRDFLQRIGPLEASVKALQPVP